MEVYAVRINRVVFETHTFHIGDCLDLFHWQCADSGDGIYTPWTATYCCKNSAAVSVSEWEHHHSLIVYFLATSKQHSLKTREMTRAPSFEPGCFKGFLCSLPRSSCLLHGDRCPNSDLSTLAVSGAGNPVYLVAQLKELWYLLSIQPQGIRWLTFIALTDTVFMKPFFSYCRLLIWILENLGRHKEENSTYTSTLLR